MSSKSVFQIFKILFETGNINIFVLRGVFFNKVSRIRPAERSLNLVRCKPC